MILCRQPPDDPMHGVAVYAAARDADLVQVNSISHGHRDWLVALLGSGDFPCCRDGSWKLP